MMMYNGRPRGDEMDVVEKQMLIDEAIKKIGTDGQDAALEWFANAVKASYEAKLKKALTRNEINDKILFQIMNY
jgi:cobalamin biosynthesis protein CbiD